MSPFCLLLRTLGANSWLAESWWVTYWRGNNRRTWWRHQENVFYWHKLWTIKITPIMYSNLTLKPELEPTVIACLAGREAQEVYSLCTDVVHWICPNTERRFKAFRAIAILARHLQCRYSQDRLFRKNIYRLAWTSKWFVKRAEALVKTICWAFWQLFMILRGTQRQFSGKYLFGRRFEI